PKAACSPMDRWTRSRTTRPSSKPTWDDERDAGDRTIEPVLRRQPYPARRDARGASRRMHGAARAQRRGQDHAAALSHGPARRALMASPKLLVLDEPTEGIQPSIIKDIGRVLQRLVGEHAMAVLLVEQYYDFAAALAQRYYVMTRGVITHQGDGKEMHEHGVRD